MNFGHVKMIESDSIYMDDGTVVPIGRTFKARIKEIWGGN
ncbi:MAG: hypothetical protein NC088_12965 [Bacteroides sp.]|nr:hypothetical protein [Bacteroides sp.]